MDIVNDVVIFDYDMLLGLMFCSIYKIDLGTNINFDDKDRCVITDADIDKYCHILSKQYIKKERKIVGINYGNDEPTIGIDNDLFKRVMLRDGTKGYVLNENDFRLNGLIKSINMIAENYSDVLKETSAIFNVYYQHSMDSCERRIKTNNRLMRILKKIGDME